MKPSARKKADKPTVSPAVWVGVALAVVGVAVAALSGGGDDRGYAWPANCGEIVVSDPTKMRAFAASAGMGASKLPAQPSPVQIEAWAAEANQRIGLVGGCKTLPRWSAAGYVRVHQLFRFYLQGARTGGNVTPAPATQFAATFRLLLIAQGAPAAQLPEGLP